MNEYVPSDVPRNEMGNGVSHDVGKGHGKRIGKLYYNMLPVLGVNGNIGK